MEINYTKEELILTGVYKITCTTNGKFYIGSASCVNGSSTRIGFLGRVNQHILKLKNNKHHNLVMQNSFNKHGSDSFVFEIIEFCDYGKCLEREQFYLDSLQPFYPNGFNICKSSLCNNLNSNTKNRTETRDVSNLNKSLRIPVTQKDLYGNILKEFEGVALAARETNSQRVGIYKCCRGIWKSANGFIWEYKNKEDFKIHKTPIKFKVRVINLKTNESTIYDSISETCIAIDYCKATVSIHIKNGFPIENKYLVEKIIL